jgi:hypothetical protein
MSRIIDLSPELLDDILRRQGVRHSAVNLWLCGNKRLHYLMSNGGVTDVLLEDTKWNSTSRWPKMLAELRFLRRLVIIRDGGRLGNPWSIGHELQRLTPRLEELEMDFREAESCFGLLSASGADSGLEEVSHGEEVVDYFQPPPRVRVWDVATVFPNLRLLGLYSCDGFLEPHDWARFPKTLKTILVATQWSVVESSHLGGLESMDLTEQQMDNDIIACLPANLTSLNNFYPQHPDTFLHFLPLSITKIKPRIDVSPELFSLLPRQLQGFRLINWDNESMAKLPESLKDLSISDQRPIEGRDLRVLPRTLTSLIVKRLVPSTISKADWPPELSKLFLLCSRTAQAESFHPNMLADLPASLKKLKIHMTGMEFAHLHTILIQFPPHLTKLELHGPLSQLLQYLPSSLQDLYCLETRSNFDITSSILSLPRGLRRLVVAGEGHIDMNICLDFPPRLTELELGCLSGILSKVFASSLPHSIQTLALSGRITYEKEALSVLPLSLDHFSFNSSEPFLADDFGELPNRISFLDIAALEGRFNNRHMSQMPRNLRILLLPVVETDLTPDAIELAPPHLCNLSSHLGSDSDFEAAWKKHMEEINDAPILTPDPRVHERLYGQ